MNDAHDMVMARPARHRAVERMCGLGVGGRCVDVVVHETCVCVCAHSQFGSSTHPSSLGSPGPSPRPIAGSRRCSRPLSSGGQGQRVWAQSVGRQAMQVCRFAFSRWSRVAMALPAAAAPMGRRGGQAWQRPRRWPRSEVGEWLAERWWCPGARVGHSGQEHRPFLTCPCGCEGNFCALPPPRGAEARARPCRLVAHGCR